VYGLEAQTPDERIMLDVLRGEAADEATPAASPPRKAQIMRKFGVVHADDQVRARLIGSFAAQHIEHDALVRRLRFETYTPGKSSKRIRLPSAVCKMPSLRSTVTPA